MLELVGAFLTSPVMEQLTSVVESALLWAPVRFREM